MISGVWLLLLTTGIQLPNSQGNSKGAPRAGSQPHDNSHHEPHYEPLVPTDKKFLLADQFFLKFPRGDLLNTFEDLFSVYGQADLELLYQDHFELYGFAVSENFSACEQDSEQTTSGNDLGSIDGALPAQREEMADGGFGHHAPGPQGGVPLHEFRKDVPPGWAPGLSDYPLCLFFDRLKLWYRIFEGDDTLVGPLVAGRLQGKAQRIGMNLRLIRPDGSYDVGSDALVRLSVEEVRDPQDPTQILQHSIPSGVQALCNALKEAFGMSDQEMVNRSIEDFFEFRRGVGNKMSFQEYSVEWDFRLEEAATKAGLELNDVAKFYLFFRGSGLPGRFVEEIKMQLQGDLRRFQDARILALRLITKKDDIGTEAFYQDEPESYLDDGWDHSDYWTDDGWSFVDDYEYAEYQDESWQDQVYYDEEKYDWYQDDGWNEGDWPEEPQEHPTTEETSTSSEPQESFPMKGKGKGPGCSVCGSRWHSASSCPAGGGKKYKGKKGKSYGKSKGYGKSGKSKGYGKRPYGKGKGKGYGKNSYGRGKGYYGYAEKTLVKSFGEVRPQPSTPPRKTVHFKLDNDEAPVLPMNRPRPTEEHTGNDAEASTTSAIAKKLNLAFPTMLYSDYLNYHTVLGEKRRGLLVDPGAASGLIGTETLRDILEHCVPKDKAKDVVWDHDRVNSVSGINGTPEATLGEVHIPLQLAGATGSFTADVLGGEGSMCPALLSNPSLRKQKASLLCDYFENGDGVMVVSDGDSGWHYLRLLLTDSGHYLLPIDHHGQVSTTTQKAIEKQLFTWKSDIANLWNDVRHCFLQRTCAPPCRELERSDTDGSKTTCTTSVSTTTEKAHEDAPKSILTTGTESHNNQATTLPKTPSTTSTVVPCEDIEAKSGSATRVESHNNRATTPKTSSTTSGSSITSLMSAPSGSLTSRPFLDGPVQGPQVSDEWFLEGNYLVRKHRVPRRILFVPSCTLDCPVSEDRLTDFRVTEIQPFRRKVAVQVLEDHWRKSANPCKDFEYLWTGTTRFRLRPEHMEPSSPPTAPMATAMATTTVPVETVLDPQEFPCYDGDHFPEHWTEERRNQTAKYYRAIPEEFYSRTGRRPVTPQNVRTWLFQCRARNLRFQVWEWFSGSGRLSLFLALAHVMVGFPVDFRYGWDVGHAPHQVLLKECQETFGPTHIFASPSCTPWSIASAQKDPHARDLDRRRELPTLEFVHDSMMLQHNNNHGFTLEQPFGSDMLKASPISRLLLHAGIKVARLDQCMLGSQDEQQRPIRKATVFVTNRRWQRTLKRCNGHRGHPHGQLQGQYKGCSRTAMAAVYPKRMCQALCQDFWKMLRQEGATQFPVWPQPLFGHLNVYYTCERCQLGRAAPPGCEHTMVPDECRYGQPSMRARAARPQASVPASTAAEASAAAPAASSSTADPSSASAPPLRSIDLENLTGPFKFLARSGDYSRVQLAVHSSLVLSIENRLYLKAALMQLVESCLDLFAAATDRDFRHWLSDPVLIRVFQEVFSDVMNVLGVLVALRPWKLQVPDPQLSSDAAPMRLLVSGHVRDWTVNALEDMRVLSHNQLEADVDEADWHVYVFGVCPESSNELRGAPPAAPYAPAKKEKMGKPNTMPVQDLDPEPPNEDDIDLSDPEQQAAQQPQEAETEEDFRAARPDEKVLKPLFDFKKVYKRLSTDLIEKDPMTAKRLLLGLHERFYHCPISDFKNMLLRAGLSSDVLPLAEEAVMSCSICRKHVRLPNRPQIKIGAGASSFNLRVQADLFMYKEKWILLMIDEATRYKAAALRSRQRTLHPPGKNVRSMVCYLWSSSPIGSRPGE